MGRAMNVRLVLLICAPASAAPTAAFERSLEASLLKLEPDTRFHQIRNIKTTVRMSAEHGPLHPDRMVMDAEREAEPSGDVIGGRSRCMVAP
jgi:hypothetical protein